jgi:hypothetical protein
VVEIGRELNIEVKKVSREDRKSVAVMVTLLVQDRGAGLVLEEDEAGILGLGLGILCRNLGLEGMMVRPSELVVGMDIVVERRGRNLWHKFQGQRGSMLVVVGLAD